MNQTRSTYKTDYVPQDWLQNNISSNTEDFCSSENVDDCLRYISREFSALGYPSIYSNENACELPVNCDFVTLLNITYELIGNCRDYVQVKEDLECRNHSLLDELKTVNRKNFQLKDNLEQSDRKYKSALEKERQTKEKNKELSQLLKIEKDENKRLHSQMLQQKKTYQHETRKHENDMSQMKSRLNQIIADKNPDKKIANINSTNLLQRNSNQRGKWKTGSVAKSNLEEMYKTVISSYEVRCEEMLKEITAFHGCLEFIQSQLFNVIAVLKVEEKVIDDFSSLTPLHVLWNADNFQNNLEERFMNLFQELKKRAFQHINRPSNLEGSSSNSKTTLLIAVPQDCTALVEGDNNGKDIQCTQKDVLKSISCLSPEELAIEKEKLQQEKLELSATMSFIEKEKSDLEIRKLEVIKLALNKDAPEAQWHRNLNTLPSFSVVQTNKGLTALPSVNQLRNCLTAPGQQIESLTPLWKSGFSKENTGQSLSETMQSQHISSASTTISMPATSEDSGLPKWAIAAMKSESTCSEPHVTQIESNKTKDDLEISTLSLSEDQSLALLNSAMEDIEKRRKQVL